jgi:outer membrane receptor protein involved in Fe transport
LPNNNELQLNYTRRVNRPRGRQINPFRDQSDSITVSYGNPDLSPEYSSAVEFNYMKTWDNHSISASAYYRFTDDVIEDVRFKNVNKMESTYMNIAKKQNTGLELVAKNSLFTILNLTSSLNLYYEKMDSTVYRNPYNSSITTTIPAQNSFTWTASMIANLMFSKTFSGQITGEYSAPTLIAQGKESAEYSVDLGLRKTFFDRKLSVNVMANDIFNFNRERTTTSGNGFYQKSESYFHGRMIGVMISYNFGNMKPKQSDMKKKGTSPDMNMDGGME